MDPSFFRFSSLLAAIIGLYISIIPDHRVHNSAGLAENYRCSSEVPWEEPELEEGVHPAGGKVAQLERRHAEAPEVGALSVCLEKHVRAHLRIALPVQAHGRADDRVCEVLVGNGELLSVQICTVAPGGPEHVVQVGVVHDAQDKLRTLAQSDGDSRLLHAAGEVCGSVDRVDDPAHFLGDVLLMVLLTLETRSGDQGQELLLKVILNRDIG